MVTLEGIVLWNNQPDREAFGLVRKGVGQSTVLRAVETPYPKVNPIQSYPIRWLQLASGCLMTNRAGSKALPIQTYCTFK